MTIHSLYILSKSGGLIYQLDNNIPTIENEKTFSYPLEVKLDVQNRNIMVVYGQRDGIKVGHTLVAVNGMKVTGQQLDDGRDAMQVLADEGNYPINLKFARPKLTTNEKIFQASMFYPLYALACQLSPEQRSSGIESIESDNFKMNCFQTLTDIRSNEVSNRDELNTRYARRISTVVFFILLLKKTTVETRLAFLVFNSSLLGVKFILISDPKQAGIETLLHRVYEIYADFALKNPFYSLEMPIRCELFDEHIKGTLEQAERLGISSI